MHWIDYVSLPPTSSLFRAIIDMTDLPTGWVSQGSVGIHSSNLYDHAVVLGSSPQEFIVSRRTAIGDIATVR
jgi:hypothetical protein